MTAMVKRDNGELHLLSLSDSDRVWRPCTLQAQFRMKDAKKWRNVEVITRILVREIHH